MALPSFRTWAANAILTAAQLNADVRDNGKFLLLPPKCTAYHNATQSIASGTLTFLILNSERYDEESGAASTIHSTVTNNSRITPVVAGEYSVDGCVQFAAQATAAGYRGLFLVVNGTTYIGGCYIPAVAAFNSVPIPISVHRKWKFNGTTDYVQMYVIHTAGVALNIEASDGRQCELAVSRVG